MSGCIQNKVKFLCLFIVVGYFLVLSACNSTEQPTEKSKLSSSEVLSFSIKERLNKPSADGNYIFVCGPCCKGCVQKTLLSLDSLFKTQTIKASHWTFISSHHFVESYALDKINFVIDQGWERVNYDFTDVVYLKFLNDSLVYSEKLRDRNLSQFLEAANREN